MRFVCISSGTYGSCFEAARSLGPPSKWSDWSSAGLSFSMWHSTNPDFALPFDPADYVWSPAFRLRMSSGPGGVRGHYRRGVEKWRRAILRGEEVPPACMLYSEDWGWTLQDGNHRVEAARLAAEETGDWTFPAVLGYPRSLLRGATRR